LFESIITGIPNYRGVPHELTKTATTLLGLLQQCGTIYWGFLD
jgi:hypothetical protein